jgi:hypothetical protein
MRRGEKWAWLGVIAASVLVLAQEDAGTGPQAFLRSALGLSASELSNVERGRAVVKTVPQANKREVITAGAIKVQAPSARFVAQFRTLEGFRTSQFVRQIARFSDPPVAGDLEPLVLDPDDLEDLRSCKVSDCGLRMAAADIPRFAEIDWRAPEANARAAALYRLVLFQYLEGFRAGGLARLPTYQDQEAPLVLGEEVRELLTLPSPLDRVPALRQYLQAFPSAALPETESFYYWSKEAFGFKPVIGLYHVSIHATAAREVFIVTSQIYASHYMDGQVSLSAVLPSGGAEDGFYWLYFNRARIGRLDSFLGTLSRSIVQRRTRNGLEKSLTQTRERMERK